MITEDDSDGDGISDADEQRFGLNPSDSADALFDLDGNGFSNLYEIENGFDPRIPNSCPPLWYRLRLRGVDRVELPLRLTSIDTGGHSDPAKWDALIKLQRRNYRGQLVWRDSSYNIGDTLELDGRNYQLVKMFFDRKVQKIRNPNDGSETEKTIDNSSVLLREVLDADGEKAKAKPEELVMTVGQPVYSPDRRVILEDIGVPADEAGHRPVYGLREGDRFTIGWIPGSSVGRALIPMTLKLVKFDETEQTALLENVRSRSADPTVDARGRRMLVKAASEIPEDLWVTNAGASGKDSGAESARHKSEQL